MTNITDISCREEWFLEVGGTAGMSEASFLSICASAMDTNILAGSHDMINLGNNKLLPQIPIDRFRSFCRNEKKKKKKFPQKPQSDPKCTESKYVSRAVDVVPFQKKIEGGHAKCLLLYCLQPLLKRLTKNNERRPPEKTCTQVLLL